MIAIAIIVAITRLLLIPNNNITIVTVRYVVETFTVCFNLLTSPSNPALYRMYKLYAVNSKYKIAMIGIVSVIIIY